MAHGVREATAGDLEAIARLTRARRRRLAEWSPVWWRPAAAADEIHPMWLGHLIDRKGTVVRVATDGDGRIVGCATCAPGPIGWIVDDLAVAGGSGEEATVEKLLAAIEERPARVAVPTADDGLLVVAAGVGLRPVSSLWIGPTRAGSLPIAPDPSGLALPEAVPHVFGPAFDPSAPGTLVVEAADGVLTGSPSIPAPPVYHPGGTVAVVDRLRGPDPASLVRSALAVAHARGDVLLAVVVRAGDHRLAAVFPDTGLVQTVEILAWPNAQG